MSSSQLAETAMQLIRSKRIAEAEQILRDLLSLNAEHPLALHAMGLAMLERRSLEEAAEYLERASFWLPKDAAILSNLAMVYLDQQKYFEAADCCIRSLAIRPDDWHVQFNLALIYHDWEKLEQAKVEYARVLQTNPNHIATRNNLGLVCKSLGQYAEAEKWLMDATTQDPNYAAAWSNLGQVYLAVGANEQAAFCSKRAVELAPEDASILHNFAVAMLETGDLATAESALLKAISLTAPTPKLLVDLAKIFIDQQRFAEAEETLHQVCAIAPQTGEAKLLLGKLASFSGKFGSAIACYREELQHSTDRPAAWYELSQIRDAELSDNDIAEIKRLSMTSRIPPRERQFAFFALGNALDWRKKYDDAFDAFYKANQLSVTRFCPDQHRDFINRIMEVFASPLPASPEIAGDGVPSPIFVFGMPRSGTTLVEQLLGQHPSVTILGELSAVHNSLRNHCRNSGQSPSVGTYSYPLLLRSGADPIIRSIRNDMAEIISSHNVETSAFVDKTPANFLYLGMIAAAFPKAKLIHVTRDPRDTCLSCFITHFQNLDFASRLEHIAEYYYSYRKLTDHWAALHPQNILSIAYEDIVNNKEKALQQLYEYCDLPAAEIGESGDSSPATQVLTASFWQARQKVYQSSIGRWRNYERHLGPLLENLHGLL